MSKRFAVLPVPAPSAIYKALDEGGVLFSTESEVYFGVNTVGAHIWDLLGRSKTLDELCAALAERYSDVSEQQIRLDVVRFLDDLVENGLVVPQPGGADGDAVSGNSE